jgi:hypothetical protein
MLKPENKKMLQICLAVVAIFTVLVSVVPTGVMVSYAKNDPRNQACYNAGAPHPRHQDTNFYL